MGTTTIRRLENRSRHTVRLFNMENQSTEGHGVPVPPGQSIPVNMWVPWATNQDEFSGFFGKHHLVINVGGRDRFWVWQAAHPDGDFIRFSTDGRWHHEGVRAFGYPGVKKATLAEAVGGAILTGDWLGVGASLLDDRTIVVMDGHFETMPLLVNQPWSVPHLLDSVLDIAQQCTRPARMAEWSGPGPVPSVPRRWASAFSVAGPPSDAHMRGQRGARYLYNDTGKRYEFGVTADGRVVARDAAGLNVPLLTATSYFSKRVGETIPMPPVDLIAAGGGRVFAKARGEDRFFFATMDHMFVHAPKDAGPDDAEFAIPSTYFKIDPEFHQPGQRPADLLATTEGMTGPGFDHHFASERMRVFRRVLGRQLTDMMVARVAPRVWQELDYRPPQNVMGFARQGMMDRFGQIALGQVQSVRLPIVLFKSPQFYNDLRGAIKAEMGKSAANESDPPAWAPSYEVVQYNRADNSEFHVKAIGYDRVLDIGVGHVHAHQQYEGVTGGEIQPVKTEADYAALYRLFNGPVADGDGYIDGTCNFYALVRHAADPLNGRPSPTYSLLFQDEQLYFSQRWRLTHPDDHKGLMFAAVADLRKPDGTPNGRYGWVPEQFWCPFRAGHVHDASRLAVAAQVCLVTGRDPDAPVPPGANPLTAGARIYSINYSWSTMDRSWRWRELPKEATATMYSQAAVDAADETAAADGVPRVYPQSIRLRDDMTLHLRGSRRVGGAVVPGRWFQRYLPADNALVPAAPRLPRNRMPEQGYTHAWKFVAEAAFQRADQYSHFGVYDAVDSRCQYYEVTPAGPGDFAALAAAAAAGATGPWVDEARQLFVSQWKFRWDDLARPGTDPMDPPSMYNPETRLRIVQRGGRWLATHWDKRDDDMTPFELRPLPVVLRRGATTITVHVGRHRRVEHPPAVRRAYLWFEADGTAGVAFEMAAGAPEALADYVARVRLASFAPAAAAPAEPGPLAHLLDLPIESFSKLSDTIYSRRWTPPAAELARLRALCSPEAEARFGTSIWFEDVVGHAAPPEQIVWQRSPEVLVTATPARVTLGVPTTVLVGARDERTGAVLDGRVVFNGGVPAEWRTNVPFTHTFERVELLAAPPAPLLASRAGAGGALGEPTADALSVPRDDPYPTPPPDRPKPPPSLTVTVHVPGCVVRQAPIAFVDPALAEPPGNTTPPIVAPPTEEASVS